MREVLHPLCRHVYVLSRVLVTLKRTLEWWIDLLDAYQSLSTNCYNTFKISVTTAHIKSSTSVNTSQLSPHNSFPWCHRVLDSRLLEYSISAWAGFLRTGDRTSCTKVHFFVIRRCHENVCQSLGNALIVSTRCCLTVAVFLDVDIPASRRHVTVWLQRTHIRISTYLDAISMGAYSRAGVTTSLVGLPFVHFAVTGAIIQSLNSLAAGRRTLQITPNYTLHTPYYVFTFVIYNCHNTNFSFLIPRLIAFWKLKFNVQT